MAPNVSRVTRVIDPLNNRTTYAYDAAGRLSVRRDARGNRTTYTYDLAGRELVRRYPGTVRVTSAYDPQGNRTVMRDATGRYTATYDALDRMIDIRNPSNRRVTYAYDAIGQRRRMLDPDNGRFTYTFDAAARILAVRNPQGLRATFSYDAADRRTLRKLANGTRTSLSYDNADRLTRIVHLKSSNVTIIGFSYKYDGTGRRTRVVETSGDIVTWTYDATYQLTRERRSGPSSYDVTHTYDPAGNRLVKIDSGARTTATYDGANHLVYSQDGTGRTTFTYDATGNLIKQKTPAGQITTSLWDFEQLNTAVKVGTVRVTYTWNGDKLRVQKASATDNRKFIYDGKNLLCEQTTANVSQAMYAYEPQQFGNLVSQRLLIAAVWTPIYCHYDALGSTAALTDSAAVVTDTYIYFAFGEVKTSTGTTTNRFTWVGERGYVKDTESGEFHLHQRQYQPDRARFKSADPLGLAVDPNLYRYVGNSAVNRTDPSGMFDEEIELYSPEELATVLGLPESDEIGLVEQEEARLIAEIQQQLWNLTFTQAFIEYTAELSRDGQLRRTPAASTAGQNDPGGFSPTEWIYDTFDWSERWSKDTRRHFAAFAKEVEFENQQWDSRAATDGMPTARVLNKVVGFSNSVAFDIWDRAFTLNIAICKGTKDLLDRDVIALRNSAGAATIVATLAVSQPTIMPPRFPIDVEGFLQEVNDFANDLDPDAARSGDSIAQLVMILSLGVGLEAELAAASRPLAGGLRYNPSISQNSSLLRNAGARSARSGALKTMEEKLAARTMTRAEWKGYQRAQRSFKTAPSTEDVSTFAGRLKSGKTYSSSPPVRSDKLARLSALNYDRRAKELVEQAATASNVNLVDLVDEVRSVSRSSNFWVDPMTGRRSLRINTGAFSRSAEHRLVESAHELVHAQRYNNILRARGGDVRDAHKAFFGIPDDLYALDEVGTEVLAAKRIRRHLGGLSKYQANETRSYIQYWRNEFFDH